MINSHARGTIGLLLLPLFYTNALYLTQRVDLGW